jgi:archaellum biogenesis ATPase FlaH
LKIESVILSTLIHDDTFIHKVGPFLKQEYFNHTGQQNIFNIIHEFYEQYGKAPNYDVVNVTLNEQSIPEDVFKESKEVLTEIKPKVEVEEEWLLAETEKFCKDRAVFNAIRTSIGILDDEPEKKDSIPLLLEDALSISFDRNVGHDFLPDALIRYDFLHSSESRIQFDIDLLNIITNNGIPKKTLTVLMAETGGGKSLGLGHLAAHFMTSGYNVLYITLELSDMRVAERIDANLLDVPLDELQNMMKKPYLRKILEIAKKVQGRLIIKEYPPATAHAGHIESLLQELKRKKDFVPDIIVVDYLNLCLSQRYGGTSHNSYTIVKGIAEELRRIAVKYDVALFSATQLNRSGYGNSDVGLDMTSESMGLPHTTDLFLAIITNEELDKNGHILIKQLKNRFGDPASNRRFLVGIDRSRMKWYNVDPMEQNVINEPEIPPPSRIVRKRDYSDIEA